MTGPEQLRCAAAQLTGRVWNADPMTIAEMADLAAKLHSLSAHWDMLLRVTSAPAGEAQEAALAREPVVSGLIAAAHGDRADVVSLAERRGSRLCAVRPCDGEMRDD